MSETLSPATSNTSSDDLQMDQMWGDQTATAGIEDSERVALFRDGNYGMFIHWGLYSHLGGQWQGETFYGIGEWIMDQMKIGPDEYSAIANEFNPTAFDANEIVRVARASGMKWIIITAKHHEGFAMFKSSHPFNIADASPFGRDPMHELASACREAGLGFGFYYSHFQDWMEPGGSGGPTVNTDGSPATFESYFRGKCYPQVEELCTNYGALDFVWFDTPGEMPKPLVIELAELVQTRQPGALLCSRIGYGMGDYASLGDMEVPAANAEGLWETCDTTNDSWSYAWYDQNWKDSREILQRLVATVGRGGTYLLNIGPDGKGNVPAAAAKYLAGAGEWVERYPQVVYSAGASPWGHAQPWGDVTVNPAGDTLNLVVFDWPRDGRLLLPGVRNEVASASLLVEGSAQPLAFERRAGWIELNLPVVPPETLASVIELRLEGASEIEQTLGVLPNAATTLQAEFVEVSGVSKEAIHWMGKFGEWIFAVQVSEWGSEGRATWTVDVAEAGDYRLELVYRGEGRLVWAIETDEGFKLQNQQGSTEMYAAYAFGVLSFATPGQHTITISLVAGDATKASLKALRLTPICE